MVRNDLAACMQEALELQDAQIDAVEAFVRSRTAPLSAAHAARAVYSGAAASIQVSSCSGMASGVTLPSDRACEVMRSRLGMVVAQHSAAAANGLDVGANPLTGTF